VSTATEKGAKKQRGREAAGGPPGDGARGVETATNDDDAGTDGYPGERGGDGVDAEVAVDGW